MKKKALLLLSVATILSISVQMMYKTISRHQLKHLKATPLDSEEKFIDVNHWLLLHKSAGIKGVIKYTNYLPPLKNSFFNKIKNPPVWMEDSIQEGFYPFKSLDKDVFKSQFSLFLQWVQNHDQERFSSYCNFVKNYSKEIPLKDQGKEAERFVHYRVQDYKKNSIRLDDTSLAVCYLMLIKYKISNGKLFVNSHSLNAQRIQTLNIILNHLARAIPLPDMEFFVSLHDWCEIDRLEAPIEKCLPIFTFSKIKNYTLPVLIPDPEMLLGYKEIDTILDKNEKAFPWKSKYEKAFWRGATSGGSFDLPEWPFFSRVRLVNESLKCPNETDARFSTLIQGAANNREFLAQLELLGDAVSIEDSLKYKYLIDVDGNACTYSRFYWILRSQSVPLKHQSSFIQWYYKGLIPFEHYIPIKEDFSDLADQVKWARAHDNEVKKIARNSSDFAKQNLATEDAYVYLYLCLMKYHSLFAKK